MMGELKGLLFELAGVDAANRSPDSGKKLAETQGEILKRRDPELAAEMLRETQRYACRSKQIDGKVGLKTVFRAQESWKEEHKKFSSKLEELELSPDLLRRYDFKLVKGDAKRFFATATGKDEMAGDAWEIDEKGEPKNTNNVCDQFLAKP